MADDDESQRRIDAILAHDRATLARAVERNDVGAPGDIFAVLTRWCHEGCHMDSVSVGVCSFDAPHDGSVHDACRALKEVARHVIKQIDDGAEGC